MGMKLGWEVLCLQIYLESIFKPVTTGFSLVSEWESDLNSKNKVVYTEYTWVYTNTFF